MKNKSGKCKYCGRIFGKANRPKGISIDIILSESNWTRSPATDYFIILDEVCKNCYNDVKAIMNDFIEKYGRYIDDGIRIDGTKRE
ncbi:MAG TPA: hypothetical protein DDW65_21690 [Firmicutes bacterium]|jgi:hypothetical protein|nr:hypothetical protein [Bacillota bacterium]